MFKKEKELIVTRAEKFRALVERLIVSDYVPFAAEYSWCREPVPVSERRKGKFKKIVEGEKWGETWENAWFHLRAAVPAKWRGKKISAQFDFNGEALIFNTKGFPLQSLSKGSTFAPEYLKEFYTLLEPCRGGEKIELWVETAANHLFGVDREEDPSPSTKNRYGHLIGKVGKMRLCIFDNELWHLFLDLDVLIGIAKALPENSVRKDRIIKALCDAVDAFHDNPANAPKCRAILKKELDKKSAPSDLFSIAVGHAHIDTGWLWRVRESIRKSARTFSSQITLLEKYPQYVFGASQPQHYAFVKEHYPELYRKIKEYVKKGRWECQGGMWVEADCNIISGESMVRQILHGKNFFMDEFGVDVKNLWLPDVFGYSANLPQIMKKTGIDYFLTTKLDWNIFNKITYDCFLWKGLDGSEVITHFPSYNETMNPTPLIEAAQNFNEHHFIDGFLTLFGVGDGGGGPKDEFIERGLRCTDTEGAPRVKFGTAQSYFDYLEMFRPQLPKWTGELYLEIHRGTLTTQAKVKKGNRKIEQALRNVEFLWTCLPLEKYPLKELDEIWKKLLINQFHDIIPGSSINEVYKDTHLEYAECLDKCVTLATTAGESIFGKNKNSVVISNCLSHPFNGVVELPESVATGLVNLRGDEVPVQSENGKISALVEIPASGFAVFDKKGLPGKAVIQKGGGLVLENDLVRCKFTKSAAITSIYDKEENRELIADGQKGNLFALYDDRPVKWDAWDIDSFYEKALIQHAEPAKFAVLPSGPVRSGLSFELKVGISEIRQEVWLAPHSKRIDFKTTVDWKERHKMLRVSFGTALNAERASYEIQYSHLERNTHRNTSWDFAKFECVGHRYADLSENDYGAALLNDCKYGYKIKDNVIDLNLLRSPTSPDPDADLGLHEFTYAFLPHKGNLVNSNVMAEAAMLNMPPSVFDNRGNPAYDVPCRLESDGISMEVLKKAEKEECVIVRLVETKGASSTGILRFPQPAIVTETDLMEWHDGQKKKFPKEMTVKLKPFEIMTFKLWL